MMNCVAEKHSYERVNDVFIARERMPECERATVKELKTISLTNDSSTLPVRLLRSV